MTLANAPAAALEGFPSQRWRSQFSHPRGLLGRLAGRVMAHKNREMHELTVELLQVRAEDRLLEIGFGHGRMIAMLAARAPRGLVCGIDPSPVMLSQARARSRAAVREGRVELVQGGASQLPWPDGHFHGACAVNSFQHWLGPAADLLEVRRVLAPGGRLLLTLRVHDPLGGRFASPGFRPHELGRVRALVREAGFADVRSETRRLGRTATCILATR